MTDDDALRARLAATDPAADAPVRPIPRSLLEQTMSTTLETPPVGTPSRRTPLVAAAAAVAVLAAGGAYLGLRGDEPTSTSAVRTSVTLDNPPPNLTAMCIQITPEVVRDVQLAFAGEVTAVEGTQVTVAVSRWFKGGTADDVVLQSTPDSVALEGGVTFTDGEKVLIAANDGQVAGCGLSGEQSPALQDLYDKAFPG